MLSLHCLSRCFDCVSVRVECCQDFWEMIVHHFVTITLMVMSWTANMIRVGTLVMCVHDAVDYFLEVREFLLHFPLLAHQACRHRATVECCLLVPPPPPQKNKNCFFVPVPTQRRVVVSVLALINVVNRHWARLLLRWLTICEWVNRLGM